jgi:hypothetical protein
LFVLVTVLCFIGFFAEQPTGESVTLGQVSTTAPLDAASTTRATRHEQSLDDVLESAKEMLADLKAGLHDYRATLVKRERINGKLGQEASMQVKIRNRNEQRESNPGLSVYLKFLTPESSAGREVIWQESRNKGKLVAHEGGFKNFIRVSLDPNGRLAMLGNKYPITGIGLINLVEKLIEKGERDKHNQSAKVTISDGHTVGDRPCQLIEVRHPSQEGEIDFHIAQIFIDTERRIPLRYAAYLWPETDDDAPPLEEEYTYLDVETNVGLTDEDFDPDNPNYEYP